MAVARLPRPATATSTPVSATSAVPGNHHDFNNDDPLNDGHGPGKVAAEAAVAHAPRRRPRDSESLAFGRLLPPRRAAAYLGVSPWLLDQFILDGSIPVTVLPRPATASAIRIGARQPSSEVLQIKLIDVRDLDRFVDDCARKVRR